MHALMHSVPPALQQATSNPHLHCRLLDPHGWVWFSLLWVHCSFLLGLGVHKVLFVPSKSLFLQSCVSYGGSVVGLMAISSKRTYATPRSTVPRAPALAAVHSWSISSVQFSSVQSLSCARLFATPWIAARQTSLSIANSRSSLRLASIESAMPSSHLILCRPLLLLLPIPPSIKIFSNESTLRMRWPIYF